MPNGPPTLADPTTRCEAPIARASIAWWCAACTASTTSAPPPDARHAVANVAHGWIVPTSPEASAKCPTAPGCARRTSGARITPCPSRGNSSTLPPAAACCAASARAPRCSPAVVTRGRFGANAECSPRASASEAVAVKVICRGSTPKSSARLARASSRIARARRASVWPPFGLPMPAR